jgi:hypothetical protein
MSLDSVAPRGMNKPPAPALRLISTRHRLSVACVLLLALAFYLWTAGSSYPFMFSRTDEIGSSNTYNLLVTAFLHGHVYLPVKVPAGLLHLKDPYSPAQNAPWQEGVYHDWVLYHGRFYSSWGPSASLLFLIVRVSGYRLPVSLAVALYSFGGLAASVALLHVLARRFVAGMPDWMLTVATICLALTNVAPFLLRRPSVYEAAISGALCFEMLGLYLIASGALGAVRRRRLAWGSLWLGLAVLARPTMAVGLPVVVVVAVLLIRRREPRRMTLISLLAPFFLCGVLLVAYNEVRFGAAGNFGTQYQLSGVDAMTHPIEHLDYIPPGVFSYLFIPGQVSLVFPHFFLQTTAQLPFAVPSSYEGTNPVNGSPEVAGGLLATMPITILLLAWPVAWIRRRAGDTSALLVVAAGAVLCLAVMVLLAYALWGTTERYEVDFASFGLIAALLMWGLLLSRTSPGSWGRRGIASLGAGLVVLGAAAGVAGSLLGYQDLLQVEHPGIFNDFRDITSPVVTGITMVTGRAAITNVTSPAPISYPAGSPYLHFDDGGLSTYIGGAPVTITVVSPRNEKDAILAIASQGYVGLAGQVIRVASAGSTVIDVPILGASLRMPVRLHRGVNQIVLRSLGATTQQLSQTLLANLQLEN